MSAQARARCSPRLHGRAGTVIAALACFLAFTNAALAQQAGDNRVQIGWVHALALNSRTSIHTDLRPSIGGTLLGIPNSFDTPGASVRARKVDILALSAAHFLSDRLSLELDAGIPPKVAIEGQGIAAPPGPSGTLFRVDLGDPALNPLGSSRQWSPVLALQYHFGSADARIRPFAGVGATYSWFTDTRLNPAFVQAINSKFGQPLALAAGKPGPTSTSASVAPLWAPVFKLGVSMALAQRWSLGASVTYVPYSTTTTTLLKAADGTTLASNRANIKVDALATALMLGYCF